MTNELALNTQMSFDDLAKLTGQDVGNQTRSFLPRLGINKDHEDADAHPVPAGTYSLSKDNVTVYAKAAIFRPYINAYQYQVYDAVAKKYPNKTILFKNFNDEQIDELGGVACGKITGKKKQNLTEAQVLAQKTIKCYRNLYGTVSMTGVDKDGAEHVIIDEPCVWRTAGSAFMPVGETLQILTKAQRLSFQATIKLDKPERLKNGATIYYVPVLKADMQNVKPITESDLELLKKFQDTIDVENQQVITKHLAAKEKMAQNDIAEEIIEAGFIDINDFHDDDLPDSMK